MPVMETVVPARSRVQRLQALEKANHVRSYRAELKDRIKRREARVAEVLVSPAPDLETMKVIDLLLAAPKVGRVKAGKLLAMAKVSPSKTLGGMTERQRGELLAVLRRSGWR